LFVDQKLLPAKTNLKSKAEKFIDKKLKYLIDDIKKKFKQHHINIEFSDNEIALPIYNRLIQQTKQAIIDIAWEQTKLRVEKQEEYQKLK